MVRRQSFTYEPNGHLRTDPLHSYEDRLIDAHQPVALGVGLRHSGSSLPSLGVGSVTVGHEQSDKAHVFLRGQ